MRENEIVWKKSKLVLDCRNLPAGQEGNRNAFCGQDYTFMNNIKMLFSF